MQRTRPGEVALLAETGIGATGTRLRAGSQLLDDARQIDVGSLGVGPERFGGLHAAS